MQAVLLAAGRGTRMGALTDNTPKPLLPVAGQPILEHIIGGLRAAGVSELVIVTGYRGDQIESALGDGDALGVRIRYRRQRQAEGTARALLLAADALEPAPFVLGWGDILVEPSFYGQLLAEFRTHPCDALLALNEVADPWQGGAVYLAPGHEHSGGPVTRIVEKPPRGTSTTRWNNAGVFVFAPRVLDYAARLPPSSRGEYELPQAIGAMLADGAAVAGLPIRGYWSDVGTPADLARAEREFPATRSAPPQASVSPAP